MPICTYLHDHEFDSFTRVKDAELNELFQEVRGSMPNTWFIQERTVIVKEWLRKPVSKTLYSIYKITHKPEVQELNFFVDGSPSSINTFVPKGIVMAYFFGILTPKGDQPNKK